MFQKSNPLNRPKSLQDAVQEFCLYFVIFLFGLFCLAVFGIFHKWLVVLFFIFFLAISFLRLYYLHLFRRIKIARFHRWVFLLIILVTLFNAFYHHDVPLSRDNAGYLTAGIMLSKADKLHFQDIISRPFNPFREADLGDDVYTSQFLPGYNTFLAFWYDLGGLPLLLWGNLTLLFLFLICFYGVACNLSSRKIAVCALLFLITFYAFLWFPRRTNSENLVMFLLWLSVWVFLRGVKEKNLRRVFQSLLPVSLIVLVRGEGLVYLLVFLFACFVFSLKKRKLLLANKKSLLPVIWVPLILALFFYYRDSYQGGYVFEHGLSLFYTITDFLKAPFVLVVLVLVIGALYASYLFLKHFFKKKKGKLSYKLQFGLAFLLALLVFVDLIVIYYHHSWKELVNWQIYRTQYVFIILGKYFLFPYFILFILGLLGKRIFKKKLFISLFLISPNIIFFLDPFVGLDQPWFLRRFYPAVIPMLFILGTLGLFNLGIKKKHRNLILVLLLLANIWVSWPIIFFSEYQGMGNRLQDFGSRFEPDSLILMDPGWHWQQWGYALHYVYGYNAVPKLDGFEGKEFEKLLASYDKIYVISRKPQNIFGDPAIPDDQLKYLFDFQIYYPTIVRTSKITNHVVKNEDRVNAKKVLTAYRTALPRIRDIEAYNLYVYEYIK